MSIPTALYFIALVLGLIEQVRARGQSLISWAVILIAIGLLWGFFKL